MMKKFLVALFIVASVCLWADELAEQWVFGESLVQTLTEEGTTYDMQYRSHGFVTKIDFQSPGLAVINMDITLNNRIVSYNAFYEYDSGQDIIHFTIQYFGLLDLHFKKKGSSTYGVAYTLSIEPGIVDDQVIIPFSADKQTINFLSTATVRD